MRSQTILLGLEISGKLVHELKEGITAISNRDRSTSMTKSTRQTDQFQIIRVYQFFSECIPESVGLPEEIESYVFPMYRTLLETRETNHNYLIYSYKQQRTNNRICYCPISFVIEGPYLLYDQQLCPRGGFWRAVSTWPPNTQKICNYRKTINRSFYSIPSWHSQIRFVWSSAPGYATNRVLEVLVAITEKMRFLEIDNNDLAKKLFRSMR